MTHSICTTVFQPIQVLQEALAILCGKGRECRLVLKYREQPEWNYGGLLKHLMHHLMKLNRALLHSLGIKWPFHFRPQEIQVDPKPPLVPARH